MGGSTKIPSEIFYYLVENLTTTELDPSKMLSPDGGNGLVWVDPVKYTKQQGLSETPSNNFNSNTPTDVPDMKLTIGENGDYVLYSVINCNNDQNEELDLYVAITPITDRVIFGTPVLAGVQFTVLSQVVTDRHQKNQDQSIQGTFSLDELEIGDIIDFQLNTRGDNLDLNNRRYIVQSWG